MNVSLLGKKIFVTGATGTIGKMVVEAAKESGAWVAGTYFQNEEEAKQLEARGVVMIQADLSDRAKARAAAAQVLQTAGHLDALVYTAGNTRDQPLKNLTDEEWDEVFHLHLYGLMACTQAVLPAMQERGSGKVVALGSMAGLTGRMGQTNYSTAKAGTIGFMKALAREAGRFGVTANVVCPGFIDSKMTRRSPVQAWERAKTESVLGTISCVEVTASFIVWLVSDLCFGVTGQVFNLDSRVL